MTRRHDVTTLESALSDTMTVDELKQLASLTGIALPTRKAELARVISGYLAGSGLHRVWDNLDELQKAAVSEVVHASDPRFPPDRFRAKYGRGPDWGSLGKYVRGARPTPLRFFFFGLDGDLVMPLDLKERLRAFVPAPTAAEVTSHEQLPTDGEADVARPLTVHTAEPAAGRELLSVLRLIDSGKVAVSDKTRRPSTRAIAAIDSVLEGGDFYPYEAPEPGYDDENAGPVRAFAWPMIVQAGGLAQLAGSKLQLTKAGRKALGEPAATTLVLLWERWLGTTVLDELARVECVKGQKGKGGRGLTAIASRRDAIAATLAQCPALRWIHTDDLLRYVWATDHEFAVARNAWQLYIDSPQYGSLGYDSTGYILEERYLLCLMFEYAATLGIVDVAFVPPSEARPDYGHLWGTDDLPYFSRYDGLMFVRITHLGAHALGIETGHAPKPLDPKPGLRVLPDFEIVASGGDLYHADRLALDTFAVPVSDLVWRLESARLLAAVDEGRSIGDIRRFLTTRSSAALPQPVVRLLDDVTERCGRVRERGLARLIECDDPALAALIANDRQTGRHCMASGERHLVVPASSDAAFRRALRTLGYLLARNEDRTPVPEDADPG
ncbi:MAG: helicase-associated domain-containing protein [Acidimicrobiales bacterium]